MTGLAAADAGDASVHRSFEAAFTRLLHEGGYLCGWSDAPGTRPPAVQVALSSAEAPQRVTAELTLSDGSPSSSVWRRVADPPASARGQSGRRRHTWRFEVAVGGSPMPDRLYRELVEALAGGSGPDGPRAIRFEYGGLAPGRAQEIARLVVAPALVASMAFLGAVLLVAVGATLDRAVALAALAAAAGLGSTALPHALVARFARQRPRLREGALADGIIFASILGLPILTVGVTLVVLALVDAIA